MTNTEKKLINNSFQSATENISNSLTYDKSMPNASQLDKRIICQKSLILISNTLNKNNTSLTKNYKMEKQLQLSNECKSFKISQKLTDRMKRFQINEDCSKSDETGNEYELIKIVGSCQNIEKKYFRLTKIPNPYEIRPKCVLRRSLDFVMLQWEEKRNYSYVCDQLKSIRQDLTVQDIRDHFALKVYKTNVRVALEAGDRDEFNICINQIKLLHEEGLISSDYQEFVAYRLLYYMFTRDFSSIALLLNSIRDECYQDPCMAFAAKLYHAWSHNNYRRFFELAIDKNVKFKDKDIQNEMSMINGNREITNNYRINEKINNKNKNVKTAKRNNLNKNEIDLAEINDESKNDEGIPQLCGKIISWFIDRERKTAFRTIIRAYRPSLNISYLSDLLGFSSVDDCLLFIGNILDNQHNLSELFTDGNIGSQKLDMKICSTKLLL